MNIFYLIDVSGSMAENGCMASVNAVMPEIARILAQVSRDNKDQGDIYMNAITFSDVARQQYRRPVPAECFEWKPAVPHGLTNLEDAFCLLESQMHRSAALNSRTGHLRPAVILLTDGNPDSGWQRGLARLRGNSWFEEAYKIGITLDRGIDANTREAISAFASSGISAANPCIINITDLARLKDVLRLTSQTVSRIGSRSRGQTCSTAASVTAGADPIAELIRRTLADDFDGRQGILMPEIKPGGSIWERI